MGGELTAIIPVAGLGTRLMPATRAIPKALFPLVAPDGPVRPVADWIAREALSAGCRRICFVTSGGQDRLLREYFAGEGDLAGRIEYVTDTPPWGFGYAVWSARAAGSGGAVMVLLGDHIHLPQAGRPTPAGQVAAAFVAESATAMVGVQVVGKAQLPLVGVCRGQPLGGNLYRCTAIVEKPDPATAARRLATPRLPVGKYLAHAGIYVFTAEIFDCLGELVGRRKQGKEVGLTEAQQLLLSRRRGDCKLCRIVGATCDVGTPKGFLAAQQAILTRRKWRPERRN